MYLRVIFSGYLSTEGELKITGLISALTDLSMKMRQKLTGRENIINRLISMKHVFGSAKEVSREIEKF